MKVLSVPHVISNPSSRIRRYLQYARLRSLKEKLVTFVIVVLVCLMFLQCGALWREGLLDRLANSYIHSQGQERLIRMEQIRQVQTEFSQKGSYSAAHASYGRRDYMEDRFILLENINNTKIDVYGIFDGHGGDFCVKTVMKHLLLHLMRKILRAHGERKNDILNIAHQMPECYYKPSQQAPFNINEKDSAFKEFYEYALKCATKKTCKRSDQRFYPIFNNIIAASHDPTIFKFDVVQKPRRAKCYVENGQINYGKMLTHELLYFDYKLLKVIVREKDHSGTTVLIAVVDGNRLVIANVGDSRAVICDKSGYPVQITVDHKPTLPREQKRIIEAGGFVAEDAQVWRTMGLLAVTRALGDYHLKRGKFVIADPDIFIYDLSLKPRFMVIACDGFWDVISNSESITLAKMHFDDEDFGAKKLVYEAYRRGSIDNITVVIIVFGSDQKLKISRANKSAVR